MISVVILDKALSIEDQLGIPILTTEARLLHLIKAKPGNSVKYYMMESKLSYRGYYNIVNRLIDKRIVKSVISQNDRRVRVLF